jgi:hypothetical protein
VLSDAHGEGAAWPSRQRAIALQRYIGHRFIWHENRDWEVTVAEGFLHSPLYYDLHVDGWSVDVRERVQDAWTNIHGIDILLQILLQLLVSRLCTSATSERSTAHG